MWGGVTRRRPETAAVRRGWLARRSRGGQEGVALVEVLMAIVMLGIVGVATTYLLLRLMAPRETAMRYEQQSLAARAAAEQVWDMFAADATAPPDACWPPANEPPPREAFMPIDVNYDFAFRCWPYVEDGEPSDTLFQVRVWLRRTRDDTIEDPFEMLALLGGY